MKNSSSNIKVWCYRRIFWNTLLIWIKIVTVYWTFVREFFIVNGELSDLRCLMNTLWTQSMKLLLSFVVHAKQKQNPLPLHTSSKHLDHFLCPHQGNYALEQLLPMFEDLYSNNNLVGNVENSFVVFYIIILWFVLWGLNNERCVVPKIIQTVYIFMVPNNINKILLMLNIEHYCLQNVIRSLLGRNYWKNNQKVKRFLQQQSTVLNEIWCC